MTKCSRISNNADRTKLPSVCTRVFSLTLLRCCVERAAEAAFLLLFSLAFVALGISQIYSRRFEFVYLAPREEEKIIRCTSSLIAFLYIQNFLIHAGLSDSVVAGLLLLCSKFLKSVDLVMGY